jgi:hypothetical protein
LVLAIILGFQLHHHGGRPLRSGLLPSLSPREGVWAGDYFLLQSGTVVMGGWPHRRHHSRAREPAPTYHWYDRFSTDSSGHRRRVASSAPAAQQPSSVWSVSLSGRVVASRCRPARHHRHQHGHLVARGSAAPRERRLSAHHQANQGRLLLQ